MRTAVIGFTFNSQATNFEKDVLRRAELHVLVDIAKRQLTVDGFDPHDCIQTGDVFA
jgi:hypothetical protein